MAKKVLSGIQPSGSLTLGNYIGAIKNFVKLQQEHECFFMVVDLHAITVAQDPAALRENSRSVAALYLAAGIDPKISNVYMQSHVPQHAELGWILTTLTAMGELERMTQFKDKSSGKDSVGAGLFVYPSLMAADILVYNADLVPVGEDQKQHLELTRDLAGRFNHRFGDFFTVPDPYIPEVGARIMSLDDAGKKMSKSNPNAGSYIALLDPPDVIRKKISRATTDSGREVVYDPANKPEISNLMSIYAECSGLSLQQIADQYEGQMYGGFKKNLGEVLVATLEPLQQRYHEIRSSGMLEDILAEGAERARSVASQTLTEVKERMGFLPYR
ncbi:MULTISPECIES: tryptophan--tRNA ligase [unclassified Paenibacillus]|uniref:tryptophan--tRNA ligase n=1 Tax=unclassified Paenibacillus TaxID=185978 RepID=UPI0024069A6D|nr:MULTISPECIES: tryptophan--tRNA ligase [unclassified Paenibacillus]MDF9842771.1 tryptophanyl-tRNA synthetase [Paenibacillus sp. PastF-2]MDF9849361.1 tryptophanyl-tRNA synthetase [Paenibacillus sp. PastM-2]MDF9855931.1 tryptophanyl-tRNA synthetase [Paenibacillus sp. PastF-1]MDH6481202.1 tryptophanyl-tRNA synthetase [Paenibacillus sp. PastH-2]MDH6508622.1 tryptophanyl-tRNA synthetase [Paenibacillus sp. PastM-3]